MPRRSRRHQHVAQYSSGGGGKGTIDPAAVSGLSIWLKADAGVLDTNDAAITVDATAVKTWQDQSGNANHFTNANAGERPLWKTNITNGKPVLRFVTDDRYSLTLGGALSQPNTIFVVGKANAADTFFVDGSGGRNAIYVQGTGTYSMYAGSTELGATARDANFHVMMGLFNGASSIHWTDGLEDATGNAGNNALGASVRIGSNSAADNFLNGDIAEILIYNAAVSAANRTLINRYLGNKYGITVI